MVISFNPTVMQLNELRRTFNDTLRAKGYRPLVNHPGDPWIFEEVLGIDPTTIVGTDGAVTKTTYRTFVTDPEGNRVLDTFDKIVSVTRKFTPEQRKLLKEWWDLLSPELRAD